MPACPHRPWPRHWRTAASVLALAAVVLLAGCARFTALRKDLEGFQATAFRVGGTVAVASCADCDVIVVAFDADGRPLSYRAIERPGRFEMFVNRSAHSVFAFHDANGNLRHDDAEPFAWQPLPASDDQRLALSLQLRPASQQAAPGARPKASLFPLRHRLIEGLEVQVGSLTDLSQPRFDPAKARLGMWQPVSFVREGLAGIYFLQPHARDKVPVLFVHGIGGTPREFAPLVQALDRSRYEPWFFYYPSGLELDDIAAGLLDQLNQLRAEHRFGELHIVAHSMGGLVGRGLLKACREANECEYVRTLTTISSPFGGANAAQMGVDHAPVVMPVWRSMSPEGAFLTGLFAAPLPPHVRHHMVFGYRNAGVGRASGDGTVPLQSQLRLEAQAQASSVLGLDADHVGILSDPLLPQHLHGIFAGGRPGAMQASAPLSPCGSAHCSPGAR